MSLASLDTKYVWHPFTQMKGAKITPIVKGEGVYLIDESGKRYIDAVSSWWVKIHGHSNPYIGKELNKQFKELDHVIFAGFTHPKAIEAAERLVNVLPGGIAKVFYSDNGSTANEVALKMAFQYWHNQGIDRVKVIAFEGAYHGDTFGGMSVSARTSFSDPFQKQLFESEYLPTPTEENIALVSEQFEALAKSGEVAAFIYEPLVQGVRGMVMHKAEHLNALLKIAKKYGILCIADEVMTGFGRTGKLFASDFVEVKPDIVALSKGLTGGVMALGVTACTDAIYNAFYDDDRTKSFLHGHSFTGNPMACTCVCASLDLLQSESTQASLNNLISRQDAFSKEIGKHAKVDSVRRQGAILAIELKTDGSSDYYSVIGPKAYEFFLERGVVMRPLGNILIIMPPYIITNEQLDEVYGVCREFMKVIAN